MKKINVVMTTYNHELYLAQAIESVMSQKGDFALELIIGDDQSADQTYNIAMEYQKRFPKVVRVLRGEKRLGVTKNIQQCLQACQGDYIAMCEGDDYWTDPYKLEKQFQLLEKHPEYASCFNAVTLEIESSGESYTHPGQALLIEGNRHFLNAKELVVDNVIGNFSCCMYRTTVVEKLPGDLYEMYTVDWMFNMMCAQHGDIGFIPEPMSVYRIHHGGAWSGQDFEKQQLDLLGYIDQYDRFLNLKYRSEFDEFRQRIYRLLVMTALEKTDYWKVLRYFVRFKRQGWIIGAMMNRLFGRDSK